MPKDNVKERLRKLLVQMQNIMKKLLMKDMDKVV
jgi:hypothetical protein